ncbi:MAG: C39 family peptidase [Omnitrophica WOR_2 bacterium]
MIKPIFIKTVILALSVLVISACNTTRLGPSMMMIRSAPVQDLSIPYINPTPAASKTNTPFLPLPPTRTPEPSLTPTQTSPPAPSPTSVMKPLPAPKAIPAAYDINEIGGHRQYLSLDCEAAAVEDWANFFGKDISEIEFQDSLPVSDNPEYGFVGNVNDPWGLLPPYGYGVYAGPVASLMNRYGVQAKAYKGYTLEQVKAKISQNIPVIAWVVGNAEAGAPAVYYTDTEGRKAIAAPYEHVVILTGYTRERIHFLSEGNFYTTTIDIFLVSWGRLGNMVIVDR